eukprot:gene99-biopygen18046
MQMHRAPGLAGADRTEGGHLAAKKQVSVPVGTQSGITSAHPPKCAQEGATLLEPQPEREYLRRAGLVAGAGVVDCIYQIQLLTVPGVPGAASGVQDGYLDGCLVPHPVFRMGT